MRKEEEKEIIYDEEEKDVISKLNQNMMIPEFP